MKYRFQFQVLVLMNKNGRFSASYEPNVLEPVFQLTFNSILKILIEITFKLHQSYTEIRYFFYVLSIIKKYTLHINKQ